MTLKTFENPILCFTSKDINERIRDLKEELINSYISSRKSICKLQAGIWAIKIENTSIEIELLTCTDKSFLSTDYESILQAIKTRDIPNMPEEDFKFSYNKFKEFIQDKEISKILKELNAL